MLLLEVRQGARSLLRAPGLTLISILTVALGVGAGSALFSVVQAVLLKPLPYVEPNRLVWVSETNDHGGPRQVAFQNFLDWRDQNHSFSSMAAYEAEPLVVAGGDVPQNSHGAIVTEDFFKTLGVQAALGRTFSHEEHVVGGPMAVVISYGLWQRGFGGDSGILGRTIRLLGKAPVVVGVLPPGFRYPEEAEIWIPAEAFGNPGFGVRTGHNYRVVARLRTGATLERAQADISAIQGRIKRQYPSPFQSKDASVISLQARVAGEVRRPLLLLFGAVGFVLLIVCVNVANLLLVRGAARIRELAVRTALGAARGRLIRQMLGESMLLAAVGGILGLLVAIWSMDLLRILLPADMPRAGDIRIDGGVIGFALAVSVAAGLLFGLLPAWRAAGVDPNEGLRAGSRSATAGRHSRRVQGALVISETCLSLMLVAGAALLARSFWNLRSVDPGFRADHVTTVVTQLEPAGKEVLVEKYRELLLRARSIPGVVAAGVSMRGLPFEPGVSDGHFLIEGRRGEPANADANYAVISPGYLQTMRIPLLRGRDFSEADTENSSPVAIINAEMARVYFPGRNPIGERIWFDSYNTKENWLTIVGIAADVRQSGPAQPVFPMAYTNYTQQTWAPILTEANEMVVRTAASLESIAPVLRRMVRAVNPDAAPTVRTMEAVVNEAVSKQRFQMEILAGFAVLALVLAVIGLYGVMSHIVTAERSLIGLRLALGASRPAVFRMVAGRALVLASIGAAIGAAGCLALRRLLANFVFGIGPNDPATLMGAAAVLLAAALAAACFPAWRATRIEPMSALREE